MTRVDRWLRIDEICDGAEKLTIWVNPNQIVMMDHSRRLLILSSGTEITFNVATWERLTKELTRKLEDLV